MKAIRNNSDCGTNTRPLVCAVVTQVALSTLREREVSFPTCWAQTHDVSEAQLHFHELGGGGTISQKKLIGLYYLGGTSREVSSISCK